MVCFVPPDTHIVPSVSTNICLKQIFVDTLGTIGVSGGTKQTTFQITDGDQWGVDILFNSRFTGPGGNRVATKKILQYGYIVSDALSESGQTTYTTLGTQAPDITLTVSASGVSNYVNFVWSNADATYGSSDSIVRYEFNSPQPINLID